MNTSLLRCDISKKVCQRQDTYVYSLTRCLFYCFQIKTVKKNLEYLRSARYTLTHVTQPRGKIVQKSPFFNKNIVPGYPK